MTLRRISIPTLIWLGIAAFLLVNLPRLLIDPTAPAPEGSGLHDGPVIISEFMANNAGDFVDEDGDASDWIELYNRSSRAVNLAGWSLTDDPDRPDKWQFEDLTLDPGHFLVVFASGKDRFVLPETPEELPSFHTNFSLAGQGGYLALHPPTARRYLDGSIYHYPPQQEGVSFGAELDARGDIVHWELFFNEPSPGLPNRLDSAWAQVFARVDIEQPAGFYDAPFEVALTSDEARGYGEGAIHYTTDGSLPTVENGLTYTVPIRIEGTTPLRAAVVREGYESGPVSTRTYLFVEDVLQQDNEPPGFPATWGTHDITLGGYIEGTPREAVYGMDPRIVNDPDYGPMVREGLTAIPSLSLVMPMENFDIYSDAHGRGRENEREVSVEYLMPDDLADALPAATFQLDAGIRMHGGAGRWSFMPKHSFRLYFRSDYGTSRLREPVIPQSPMSEFNRLVLRAGSDRSFVGHPPAPGHVSVDHRLATYTRDEWARASQVAMSGYGSHGTFVHLYINGVYWGLYNLVERLDTAFAAIHLGGDDDDWFSVTQGGMRDGMPDRFLVMLDLAAAGGLADPERYATMLEFVDPIQFSDYVILQWYTGNRDWPENNWTVNVQNPAGRNLFFVWDAEDTWHDGAEIRLGEDEVEGAPFPNVVKLVFEALWENPDFRLLFADRLYAQLHHDGALTDANVQARWLAINAEIETAIAAESARWGYERYAEPITPDDWRNARDLVLAQMEGNGEKLLALAREAGFYPLLDPPQMSRQGGEYGESLDLALTAPASAADAGADVGADAAIYYTLDGTDPREPESGAIAPAAQLYTAPIHLTTATVVKARLLVEDPTRQDSYRWSALNEAQFHRAGQVGDVRITEIMYNPIGGGDFEFLEIMNIGEMAVDLSGARFEGINFRFEEYRSIEPGERWVLARDFTSYRSRYPEAPIYGVYGGRLSNQGETIALYARSGAELDAVTYGVDGRWPMSASGTGDSLVRYDFDGDPNRPESWRASAVIHGSPGAPDGEVVAGETEAED